MRHFQVRTLSCRIFRETLSIEKGFGPLSLKKITKLFYQKTAKEMFTLQSHFIYSFCKQFFACEAPNFVENCISIYDTWLLNTAPWKIQRNTVYRKRLRAFILEKNNNFFLSEDCKIDVYIVITFYLLFL